MTSYTITEPHPTVLQNSFTHSGRGGRGNFFRAPATTSPSGVPTPATRTTSASTRNYFTGRGGAGNAHAAGERPVLSFDEEYSRAEVREKTAIFGYAGRGGAGNIFHETSSKKSDVDGEELARADSASSGGSSRSGSNGFWDRVRSIRH
ncbi:hypothetical protein N657DRAFT_657980 [Parathielavia appendiculata]|uniref:Uncharacterized protein n=1 Tax=Parathielavia appendiculata TaxID=2587402 RepID=A0AAN6Z1I0_9PEZI|nr:hypothetical protein N657DRAFT_657980 [Parathielavia appendiculata]